MEAKKKYNGRNLASARKNSVFLSVIGLLGGREKVNEGERKPGELLQKKFSKEGGISIVIKVTQSTRGSSFLEGK